MPSLKEIKGRINSISSTLAITSAMKMVAAAKLQKAQMAIQNMLPYERRLHSMLIDLMGAMNISAAASEDGSVRGSGSAERGFDQSGDRLSLSNRHDLAGMDGAYSLMAQRQVRKVAIVAFASNSSLCGAFNSNAIREATAVINEYRASGLRDSDIVVYSVGRKMAEAMRKLGFPSPADFTKMSDSPSYEAASALAQELLDGFVSGRFDKVELVYNHYKSTSSQPTTRQTYLPLSLADATADLQAGKIADSASESDTNRIAEPVGAPVVRQSSPTAEASDLIVEPSKEELIATLLPKVIRLRIFTTLLDSAAAEHAARTVAMQLATDNGNDLLQELTLEYNKGRQQKITSEILDLVGGSLQ
jgi:F-type H+-transporting ATPase subunit gamma